jgi:methyltransferase-like protein
MPQPRQNLCKTEIKIKTVIERNQAKKDHTNVEILNKPERLQGGGEDLNTPEG